MTEDLRAELMIEKWLEYCNLWATKEADAGDPDIILKRGYVLDYTVTRMGDYNDEEILRVYMALDDELHSATLLGVFEKGELVHLTSEVDTSWREVGYAEFPVGLITKNNPWKRSWKFVNIP